MRKYGSLLLVLSILLATGSCRIYHGKLVRGNGVIKTEEKSVKLFKNVEVDGNMNVLVSQEDNPSVKIETDDNLLPFIEISQEGDKIYVHPKRGYNLDPSHEIKVYTSAPVYNDISVSGSCNITGQMKIVNKENLEFHVSGAGDIKMEIEAPKVTAEISGSGSMYMKGQAKDVDLGISGAGQAHCYDLLSENTSVSISGAGDAEVFASVSLEADVSGAGSVSYKGGAASVNQHVSGAGSVRKVN